MNWWFIVAGLFSILAAISSGIGVFVQQRKDFNQEQKNSVFQSTLETYVEKEDEQDRPVLKITSYLITNLEQSNFRIVLANHGRRSAVKPTLVVDEHPFKIVSGMRSSFGELPNGVTVNVNLDAYLMGLNAASLESVLSKDELLLLQEYKSGSKAIVTSFHFEYSYEGENYRSDEYSLIFSPLGDGILAITSNL